MTKRMKAFRILTALVFVVVALASLTPQPILALSSSIIIAEVYGGGSAAGSSLPDYLVLFNMSSEAQSMNNWKLYGIQGSGLGDNNPPVIISGTIAARDHFLIQLTEGNFPESSFPSPDLKISLGLRPDSLAVRLTDANGLEIDKAGFGIAQGTSAPKFGLLYETESGPHLSESLSGRRNDPCVDTDNNKNDFSAVTPDPLHADTIFTCAAPPDPAPAITGFSFDPVETVKLPVGAGITVSFSESVSFPPSADQKPFFFCNGDAQSQERSASLLALPVEDPVPPESRWLITPVAALPYATDCTLNIPAASLSDSAGNHLAQDGSFSFTTQSQPPPAASITEISVQGGSAWAQRDASLNVSFSTTLTPPEAWFSLSCNQIAIPATFSPVTEAQSFNIQPGVLFEYGANCALTIQRTTFDPALDRDYSFNFTVRSHDDPAPTLLSSLPAHNASNVNLSLPIRLNFSEPVTIDMQYAVLDCGSGMIGMERSTDPSNPNTLLLTPEHALPAASACTLSVPNTAISDNDLLDPPDNPSEGINLSFTTAAQSCLPATHTIMQVQGTGAETPYLDQTVTVQGVVTALFPDLKGFAIQDPVGDANPASSDGIFVYIYQGLPADIAVGDQLSVTALALEYLGQTQLSSKKGSPDVQVVNCGATGLTFSPIPLSLPFDSYDPEPYEGMLVSFAQPLVITEHHNYQRYGYISLSSRRYFTPTAIYTPGPQVIAAQQAQLRDILFLDDASSAQNPRQLRHPDGAAFSLEHRFRGGDEVIGVTGLLDQYQSTYRIQPTAGAQYQERNPRPPAPQLINGELRIASLNVLNYFTTLDQGSDICGPDGLQECRGADNLNELERQRDKLVAAIKGMQADVIGLIEIENDRPGQPADYAVDSLVAAINAQPGYGNYAYVPTGAIGNDVIKVALIYNTDKLTLEGSPAIISAVGFDASLNRPALAQSFKDKGSDQIFTVAVNHLKSKSSACENDPDLGDGAGNCNLTRTSAAAALVKWLSNDPTGTGSDMFLILGDLNAYAQEDPIYAIRRGPDGLLYTDDDFINIIERFQGPDAYSYSYDGAISYLDHGLANRKLASYILDAGYWHINADEPSVLDYDTSYKPAEVDALYEPNAYRSSDHDPILISLLLNYPPQAKNDFYRTDMNLTLRVAMPDGVLWNDRDVNIYDHLTVSLVNGPRHGSLELKADGSFVYKPELNWSGDDSFVYRIHDAPGLRANGSQTATVTIRVFHSNIPAPWQQLYLPVIRR